MKKIFMAILAIVLLIIGVWFFSRNDRNGGMRREGVVLENTYNISKEYVLLRYRTDNLLIMAKDYSDYASWDEDMSRLISDWMELEKKSQELEESADKIVETTAVNFKLVKIADAYSAKEISDIYDKAPKFKGIATLAKHLGVDAKRAQLILNQAQDQTTAEGWTEAGDTLQKLETSAVVIKDGCKVAGYVGGVVITGGAAGGFAAAGTLAQVTTVVVGVDLALEVTEDGAQIALGDKNKVSSFVKDIRTVTEPVASVLTITNIPNNLSTAYGKFDSVMFGLEQFRDSAQEGKVVGVDLRNFKYQPSFQVIKQAKYPGTVTVAEMEKAEVEQWLKSLNKEYKPMSQEEVEEFLSSSVKETESEQLEEDKDDVEKDSDLRVADNEDKSLEVDQSKETENPDTAEPKQTANGSDVVQGLAGTYSGSATLEQVEEDIEADDSLPVTLQLNESGTGTVNVDGFSGKAQYAGSNVSFSVSMKEGGAVINGKFSGRASRQGDQVIISGNIRFSMMGVNFATYAWSAQK